MIGLQVWGNAEQSAVWEQEEISELSSFEVLEMNGYLFNI